MQKSYVLYQLSFLRRGQKKCPLFFKPSIVLSILNIVKHRLHVWVAVTRLLVLGRARTSFSSASSEPFLAAMDRKNSSQAADGEDQVSNEDTSQLCGDAQAAIGNLRRLRFLSRLPANDDKVILNAPSHLQIVCSKTDCNFSQASCVDLIHTLQNLGF